MAHNSNRERYRKNRQRYRMMRTLSILGVVVVVVLALVLTVLHFKSKKQEDAAGSEQSSSEMASSEVVDSSAASEPEAEKAEEELFYEQLQNNPNATRTAPQVKDPATWEANAKEILEGLAAANGYNLTVKEGYPYLIVVNRSASTATVYTANAEGKYMVPYMAMVVSCGKDNQNNATPTGQFNTYNDKNNPNDGNNGDGWKSLNDGVYGQYATRIKGSILFHSVPYLSKNKADLEYEEYNNLGAPASAGCVRMAVVDVKWIRDNCPLGTPVIIYDDAENPGPMGKPGTINMEIDNEALRGWDPTDPDANNPWPEQFRTGTAILSKAATEKQSEGSTVSSEAASSAPAVVAPKEEPAASSKETAASSKPAASSKETAASSKPAASSKETAASSKPAASSKETAASSKPTASSKKTAASSKPTASSKETAASSKETVTVSKESAHETVTETPEQEEKAGTTAEAAAQPEAQG